VSAGAIPDPDPNLGCHSPLDNRVCQKPPRDGRARKLRPPPARRRPGAGNSNRGIVIRSRAAHRPAVPTVGHSMTSSARGAIIGCFPCWPSGCGAAAPSRAASCTSPIMRPAFGLFGFTIKDVGPHSHKVASCSHFIIARPHGSLTSACKVQPPARSRDAIRADPTRSTLGLAQRGRTPV